MIPYRLIISSSPRDTALVRRALGREWYSAPVSHAIREEEILGATVAMSYQTYRELGRPPLPDAAHLTILAPSMLGNGKGKKP